MNPAALTFDCVQGSLLTASLFMVMFVISYIKDHYEHWVSTLEQQFDAKLTELMDLWSQSMDSEQGSPRVDELQPSTPAGAPTAQTSGDLDRQDSGLGACGSGEAPGAGASQEHRVQAWAQGGIGNVDSSALNSEGGAESAGPTRLGRGPTPASGEVAENGASTRGHDDRPNGGEAGDLQAGGAGNGMAAGMPAGAEQAGRMAVNVQRPAAAPRAERPDRQADFWWDHNVLDEQIAHFEEHVNGQLNDQPLEQLLGLRGPLENVVLNVVTMIIFNAALVAGLVWLPLRVGGWAMAMAASAVDTLRSSTAWEAGVMWEAVVAHGVTLLGLSDPLYHASPHQPWQGRPAATSPPAPGACLAPTLETIVLPHLRVSGLHDSAPLNQMSLQIARVVAELEAQVIPPTSDDLVDMFAGYAVLMNIGFAAFWGYLSFRVWSRRPATTLAAPASLARKWFWQSVVGLGVAGKFVLLLFLELLVFPTGFGYWLHLCMLPVFKTTTFRELSWLSLSFHWLCGMGFLLGFTSLVRLLREVLRPGALRFLRDPTRPDQDPFQEMASEPLAKQLLGIVISCVIYANLGVIFLHIPSRIARYACTHLYPIKYLFSRVPLSQLPVDLLLFHIFLPFTIEHFLQRLVKESFQAWLRWASLLSGLDEYLLPSDQFGMVRRSWARVRQWQANVFGKFQLGTLGLARALGVQTAPPERQRGAAEESADRADGPSPAVCVASGDGESAGEMHRQGACDGFEEACLAPTEDCSLSDDTEFDGESGKISQRPAARSSDLATSSATTDTNSCSSCGVNQAVPLAPQESDVKPARREPAQSGVRPTPAIAVDQSSTTVQREPHELESDPTFPLRVACLVLIWGLTMVVCHALMLIVPVSLGRALCLVLFDFYRNAFRHLPGTPIHDLFTSYIGMVVLYSLLDLGRTAIMARHRLNAGLQNMIHNGLQALGTFAKCSLFLVVWLGLVAAGFGSFIELALRPIKAQLDGQAGAVEPLRAWSIGITALMVWHLAVKRTEVQQRGREPAHHTNNLHEEFAAMQRNGLMNLRLGGAMRRLVGPLLLRLLAALGGPWVFTRVLLPLLGAPEKVVAVAELHAHLALLLLVLVARGVELIKSTFRQLHDVIRDDQYLVRQQLIDFEQ
eukprot:evm.model.scf_960EXC.3 EVM.evm.TU.scf_960EXC.3   scf_960EXC:31872-38552(+)